MKRNTTIDRFALKRDKDMTPGARLDWLATTPKRIIKNPKKE